MHRRSVSSVIQARTVVRAASPSHQRTSCTPPCCPRVGSTASNSSRCSAISRLSKVSRMRTTISAYCECTRQSEPWYRVNHLTPGTQRGVQWRHGVHERGRLHLEHACLFKCSLQVPYSTATAILKCSRHCSRYSAVASRNCCANLLTLAATAAAIISYLVFFISKHY